MAYSQGVQEPDLQHCSHRNALHPHGATMSEEPGFNEALQQDMSACSGHS